MFTYPPIPKDILSLLKSFDEFVVIGHVNPDGDCLSSQMAMRDLLQAMGKTAHMANAGPFDRSEIKHLRRTFLTHVGATLRSRKPLVVVVDCSSVDRIGYLGQEITGLETVVFDHHSSGEQFGDYRYIVPESVSTTMILMHLFRTLDIRISEKTAEHLFFGFATDTGFFKFINAKRGETLRMAADLVDLGVSPNKMNDRMNGGKSFGYVKYLGKLIDRTESHFGGKLMTSASYLSDSETYVTTDKPSDMLYSQLLSVRGVQVVLFFKELSETSTEIGFRASHQSKIDVGALAEGVGGGGHKKAAGATVGKNIEVVKKELIDAVGAIFA